MRLDNVNFEYNSYLNHALSLLFAERPHLLNIADPEFSFVEEIPLRDRRLLQIARFLTGSTTVVDFMDSFEDIGLVDMECMVLSFEVMLAAKNLQRLEKERLNQS